jgi:antitoxin PrlF
MAEATITSKGQITIPKEVRDKLRLKAGHRVEFYFDPGGQVIFRPRTGDIRDLRGVLRRSMGE